MIEALKRFVRWILRLPQATIEQKNYRAFRKFYDKETARRKAKAHRKCGREGPKRFRRRMD